MNWKSVVMKFTSRKFWAMMVVVAGSVCVASGVDSDHTTKIVSVVSAAGTAIAYIFSEAFVDSKNVNK